MKMFKTGRWAVLGAIGVLALGATACAYDDYGDYHHGRGEWRGDRDRDGRDRDGRGDHDGRRGEGRRDRDGRGDGHRDGRGDRDGRRGGDHGRGY